MKVCGSCFSDTELKRFIESNMSSIGICDYCDKDNESELIELNELLDFFSEFLDIFQEDKNGKPLLDLITEDWELFYNNEISSNILIDVFKLLNSDFSNPTQNVIYSNEIIDCTSYWEDLKNDLKWKRRFLTDVNDIFELGWDGFFNKQSILSDDVLLYRARIHKNDSEPLYEVNQMGCPDKTDVSGGRANPEGIPYLYLSITVDTTFYETRATYLDEVSIGSFKIKEKVVLVDFTEESSAFMNMGNILEYTKSMLLKKYISSDLSKPLRRYDSVLEYIPTQFICEFIRYITNADGIVFNSSLHLGGKNIVLFEENKVECFEVNKYRVKDVNISHTLV